MSPAVETNQLRRGSVILLFMNAFRMIRETLTVRNDDTFTRVWEHTGYGGQNLSSGTVSGKWRVEAHDTTFRSELGHEYEGQGPVVAGPPPYVAVVLQFPSDVCICYSGYNPVSRSVAVVALKELVGGAKWKYRSV